MSLRILIALATLCSLSACDPALLADEAEVEAEAADIDDSVDGLAAFASACEESCLERSVRRCNSDVMGHCVDAAVLGEVMACLTDECGISDPGVEAPDAELAPAPDPVAASTCVNLCSHEAELDQFDCYADHGTPTECRRVRTNSFNVCYYDNCCSIWDYNCTPPKV